MKNYIGLACHAIASGFAVGWAYLDRNSGYDDCKPAEEVHADYGRLFFDTTSIFSAESVAGAHDLDQSHPAEPTHSVHPNAPNQSPVDAPGAHPTRSKFLWGCIPFLPIIMLHALINQEIARITPALILRWTP